MKKLYKIAGIIALSILALPVAAYFLVQSPSIQTYLTRQIAKQVSDNLNAKFEIGSVDIVFFNKLLLRDVRIEDQQGDTLLKASRVFASIHRLNRSSRRIVFNKIQIQDAQINIRSDADSLLNLQFIVDAVRSKDSTKVKWNFAIDAVHLKDTRLTFRNHNPVERASGINFTDIGILQLNLLANKISTNPDSIHFNISYLNLKEKSGFSLDHFSSDISITSSGIYADELQLVTPRTRVDTDFLSLDFTGFDSFKDFVNMVGIDSHFNTSTIHSRDLAFFAPKINDINMDIRMSGVISGTVNNLKGNNLSIRAFGETSLLADVTLVGLPVFEETFIFLDLQQFTSSAGDISEATKRGMSRRDVEMPYNFLSLGKLSYEGKFTGFIDDFVAYGELTTDLGTVITDLSVQPGSGNLFNFNGRLKAVQFDAGSFAGSGNIGNITFEAGLKGHISPAEGIYADLEGVIDSVFMFNYNYSQIQLSGNLADKKFEGSAHIDDPNLRLQFIGSIDLTGEIPVFDFTASIDRARLYDLKLNQEDPSLVISFLTTANFRGNNLDNLNGSISLVDAVFEKQEETFKIEVASIEASGTKDERQINLTSNLADAGISGSYEYSTIAGSIRRFIRNYIPSYHSNTDEISEVAGNKFSFFFHLKELSDFTEFFIPDIGISAGSMIEGTYDPSGFISGFKGHSRELRIGNNIFYDLDVASQSDDSLFTINAGIVHAAIGKRITLENIALTSDILNDSISFQAGWDNENEDLVYKGDFLASVYFKKHPDKTVPLAEINILPSSIIMADSVWNISRSRILIDSSSYKIDNFLFSHDVQDIRINGTISENPHDSLFMGFAGLDLKNIELLTVLSKFHLAGVLTGNAILSDVYNNPVFKTDLAVEKLFINQQDYGDLSILSQWDNIARSISIHTFSDRENDRIIDIAGIYLPEGGIVDFNIELNKVNLRTFDGYLDVVFGDLRGLASGNLKLKGNIRQPVFNGNLLIQKASFMVDYLKTTYNFTHELEISNNNILFNDLTVYDTNHNICKANGTVSSKFFKNFALNIYLYPDAFMGLNTTAKDNELFYGRVLASGLVHINGPVNNLMMNISVRTNRNTQFFIPLQKNSEVGELHFLNFTGNKISESDEEQETGQGNYQVNLSGIQLNFDLDITPDAEVQIIFDSKIGDIIKARGNGSFKMDINTQGRFNMFGEYTIEQGEYLFTLQNVINKRFDIENGSRLSWNGDPFDANVDLIATYRLRAPLKPLDPWYFADDRRLPVECKIYMKNKLMLPDISFDIELPTADTDTQRKVQGILNTEEIRNRQFLSLLVIYNFIQEQGAATPGYDMNLGMSATEAGITTVSEFFSNQLSNWLSQLSRDVDFGVNWRPGDDITPDEVELALSTQVFNDRVSINGHVDVGGRRQTTSNIVGDFDVDIKLNKSGKLRLKAFTRANDNLIRLHLSPYTQGVGLFYREEFDNFDELINRYWNKLFTPDNNEDQAISE